MPRKTGRRPVLKALGAAFTMGTMCSERASVQETHTGRSAVDTGNRYSEENATDDFELWGLHDILIDDTVVDDDIMYDDVNTILQQYSEHDRYEVVVTYDTDITFCPDSDLEEFARYDLDRLDHVGDGTVRFARYDHGDADLYSFERVFFDEWFDTVDQLERMFNGKTKIGKEELGVEVDRVDYGLRNMEPLAYWLQVHGEHGGKYYLHVPGDHAVMRGHPTQEDLAAWEDILREPALVTPGRYR